MKPKLETPFVQIETRGSLTALEGYCSVHCNEDNCLDCEVARDKALLKKMISEEVVN